LPFDMLPYNPKGKYLYVLRNPKDALTSLYHHMQSPREFYNFTGGSFDGFLDYALNDRPVFGDYFDNLLSWLPHIHKENVCLLFYEDMKKNLRENIIKIATFVGHPASATIKDENKLANILAESTVEAMKSKNNVWTSMLNIVRKGEVGDWRNYFSKEQSNLIDLQCKNRLKGTEAENWWVEEMKWK